VVVLLLLATGCSQASSDRTAASSTVRSGESSPAGSPSVSAGEDEPVGSSPSSVGTLEVGVFQDREAPFPSSEFMVTGRWSGVVKGRVQVLYVGSDPRHSGRGRAVLLVDRLDGSLVAGHEVKVSPGTAELRVVSYTLAGGVVLQSVTGQRLRYDPQSERITS
jgi:hypothetical protein